MSRFDRRKFVASSLIAAAAATPLRALAQDGRDPGAGEVIQPEPGPAPAPRPGPAPAPQRDPPQHDGYTADEVIQKGSDFLGVTAEAIGAAIERISKDNGRDPTAYIAGSEFSGSFIGGVRYGKGVLYLKHRPPREIFWQGPSVGFDWGGNAARNFTLCYGLEQDDELFQRYPGVEGSAYFIGGLGVNYQKANDVVLAPIRAGVGLRLGANVGYLAYSRERHLLPF
jgi:hypothetical protein